MREEVIVRKNKRAFFKGMAELAYITAKKEANSVCYGFFCQPELPEKVKKLRKQ